MPVDPADRTIFRPEAIEHARSEAVRGGLLRVAPPWTIGLYASLMAVFLAAVGTAAFGTIRIHSSGRGVMISEARVLPVRAPLAGIVQLVTVHEGDMVSEGQKLLAFDDAALLADPDRMAVPPNMLTLQQQRLDVRAAGPGVVDRLLVRPGAYVAAGDLLATIVPVNAPLIGYVSLPARDWPYLHRDDPIALKFDAYPWEEMGVGWGRVTRVGADADASLVRVEINVERMPPGAPTTRLTSGMAFTGEVTLRTARIYELLLKPLARTPSSPSASIRRHVEFGNEER